MESILERIPGIPDKLLVDRCRSIIEDMRRGIFILIIMLVLIDEDPIC